MVEITEHAPIDDYESLRDALAACASSASALAIDDAGAGFASLRHILRLEPELIKLDRTLIDGIESDRSRQALAAGLISFAEKIDATIVAEGIERPAEVEKLAELGVRYGQGYFFARPAPLPLPLLVGATAADRDVRRMSGTDGKAMVAASTPIRCIVADDHPAILDAVSRFLDGERGFELVGRAGDGEAALQLIEELEPEIALLDIRMPGLGGIDIAAKLAAASLADVGRALHRLSRARAAARGARCGRARLHPQGSAARRAAARDAHRRRRRQLHRAVARRRARGAGGERAHAHADEARARRPAPAGRGHARRAGGRTLSISPLTVRTHVQHAMAKLKCDTRTQAVAVALRESLID